ncbi:retinol dehydrogenase 13-like isoform X2 [Lutzomyia longipalpis]|uniref:retinol dehydrogenase 13-like isoform X2 n=1 Tax=Lutzomyia longipalpis TaxID=7200 RepID=UPI00248437CC|nr:retinol dehydrogenase 13-like isoform X2 [Lutzomyia longipalpis]XP_055690853.1 retinol dehydrogenase 13-like isoform X2 [Lutzomyia longipalpis]
MAFAFLQNKKVVALSAVGTIAGLTMMLKDYMQGGRFKNPVMAEGKVVIITGANTGIGKETAKELARRKAHVYMVCRDMEKCEQARTEIVLDSKNKYVYCRECDLSSFDSIRKFVDTFKHERDRLDILINNAGVMRCPRTLTKDGIEMQLGVNHMGHFLLTNLLLDTLKASAPSRIVVVSSLAHTRGEINITDLNSEKNYEPGRAYNQSKLANVLFTKELAKKLQGTGVTVNALHPGVVDTELTRHMGLFNSFFSGLIVKPILWPFFKSPVAGAQTTLYCALEPELEGVSGQYFSDCAPKEVADAAKNENVAKWLWAVSEKWTGLDQKPPNV